MGLTYENGAPFSYFYVRADMKVKNIEEIRALCERIAAPLSLRIADVEFKNGKNPALTVFIDKEGGVDLDDCEAFHNAISDPLDELDPTFGQPYTLNVSSPGADRPFKTPEDFMRHIGTKVEVKLYASVRGKKFFEGVLTGYTGEKVSIKTDDGASFEFDMKNVVKVNEYIDFS